MSRQCRCFLVRHPFPSPLQTSLMEHAIKSHSNVSFFLLSFSVFNLTLFKKKQKNPEPARWAVSRAAAQISWKPWKRKGMFLMRAAALPVFGHWLQSADHTANYLSNVRSRWGQLDDLSTWFDKEAEGTVLLLSGNAKSHVLSAGTTPVGWLRSPAPG